MTNFFSLIKVQLLSLFGSNKLFKNKNKKRITTIGIVLILMLIGGALSLFGYVYSNLFAQGLLMTGNEDKLIPAMIAIASLIAFMFSFYSIGSTLFGFKDYDMLMSMPIKPTEIVLSKFNVLYLSELFFNVFIIVPSLFVYNTVVASLTFVQVVSVVVLIIFAPLLPLAFSCIIGVITYYISSRFRKKNVIQLILLMLVMLGVFAISFVSGMYSEDSAQLANSVGVIEKIYFIFPFTVKALFEPIWLLVFIATNILPLAIVIIFICLFYKKLNSIFTAKRTLRNFKLKEYQTSGVNKTLFNKEIKRLFSCPVYAINSLLGVVMALIVSIVYVVIYNAIGVKSEPVLIELFNLLNKFVPAIFCFMFLLAPSTCCSISLEGQTFWIIKTAPVSYMQVLNSKLSVHAVFSTLVAFVCSLCIGVGAGYGVVGSILLVVCAVGISSFGGVFGLLMNLRFPKLKWENENIPVKQSLPTFLTMLIAFVTVVLIVVINIYMNLSLNILLAIYASFFNLLAIILYIVLYKYGNKMFAKLN